MNGSAAAGGAPAIIPGQVFSLDQVIGLQQEFKRTGAFTPLARLMTVIFIMRDGERCPDPGTDIWGRSLEFGVEGPLLAVSADGMHLLTIGNFPLRLPDVPNPSQDPQAPPRIPQRYADRSDKHLSGTSYAIFEPIYQLLGDPVGVELPGLGPTRPPLVANFRPDGFGKEASLLIHTETGEGFLCHGSYSFGPGTGL
jgi:hypothetical protein